MRCNKCNGRYTANGGGHCTRCCTTFTSDSAFDAHRKGPFHPTGLRYCEDVRAVEGWRETTYGWTNRPQRPVETYSVSVDATE